MGLKELTLVHVASMSQLVRLVWRRCVVRIRVHALRLVVGSTAVQHLLLLRIHLLHLSVLGQIIRIVCQKESYLD